MLLCDDRGRVVYSNIEARQLLADGRRVQSAELSTLLDSVDADLSSAILAQKEGLISVGTTGSDTDTTETYYLSCRFFSLNGRIHQLHLIRRMTREIARQEVNTWKRVIRVISHELNNSLAPISSLSHSGKIALAKITSTPEPDPDSLQKLDKILLTIGERASHLKDFIEGYARFARLPAPRIQSFDLVALVDRMLEQQHFEVVTHHSRLEVQLDQTQFEQVLINLLKNAREASGEQGQVQVKVEQRRDTLLIVIADDGPGMSEQVMQQALLPFYSTKSEGTGLGLPLCREIIEAHGGQLSIKNGADKGLEVVLRLPQGESR
jgi:signal transduction histidine kinase